jgi:hypothetical protein
MDASRSTDASPCAIGFIGDGDDPWVASIADAIATGRPVHRVNGNGTLPDRPFGEAGLPRAIVIHRHRLGAADAERLKGWRAGAGSTVPYMVLCVSPFVRYEELERWSSLVDFVVSEAVAADVLPGRLARRLDGDGRRRPATPPCRVEVSGGDDELCRALVDACVQAGYAARAVDDLEMGAPPPRPQDRGSSASDRVLTIWEAPVLEADWAHRLEWRVHRTGPVIALAGFADRAIVARARKAGAVACLELPCDFDDLVDAVDRAVSLTSLDSWPIPSQVEPPAALPPARRKARRVGDLVAQSRWPDRGPLPRIPS